METYEAMYIFPDRLKEEDVDGVLKDARAEIERLGGTVISSTRLGRRPFARPIKKTDYGHYAVATFTLDNQQVPALHARARLSEDVLRLQVVRTPAPAPAGAAED